MADGPVIRQRGARAAVRSFARVPDWGRVLVVYGAARVVTTVFMLVLAARQGENPWTGASPGYAAFASIWDGRWYQIVAFSGYPSELPMTDDGHVSENAWAFMPVYPAVVRGVMGLSGLPWEIAALVVSIPCGFAAAVVFHKLLRRVLDPATSMFAVVLFSVAPASPVFQVAYAESLAILLLAFALYLTVTERYLLAIPIIIAMGLTRPMGLAFALFLLLHLVRRWWQRTEHPFSGTDAVRLCAAGLTAAAVGIAWPLIAWAVTGSASAYTDTELAWRSSYIGYSDLVPFHAWIAGADWWGERWFGVPHTAVLLIPILVGVAVFLLSRPARRIGADLRLWTVSYLVYLLAVFFPQSSTFRLLAPAFPVAGILAVPRSRVYRTLLVLVSLALQWWWLVECWAVSEADWTPP